MIRPPAEDTFWRAHNPGLQRQRAQHRRKPLPGKQHRLHRLITEQPRLRFSAARRLATIASPCGARLNTSRRVLWITAASPCRHRYRRTSPPVTSPRDQPHGPRRNPPRFRQQIRQRRQRKRDVPAERDPSNHHPHRQDVVQCHIGLVPAPPDPRLPSRQPEPHSAPRVSTGGPPWIRAETSPTSRPHFRIRFQIGASRGHNRCHPWWGRLQPANPSEARILLLVFQAAI